MKHTPEPWKVDAKVNETYVRGPENELIADTHTLPVPERYDEEYANASRIVACVNACEGINPEAVPNMLKALKLASAILGSVATHPGDEFQKRENPFAFKAVGAAIAKGTKINQRV